MKNPILHSYYNRLLFRFLVLASLVFVVVVGLVYWQESDDVGEQIIKNETLRKFSDTEVISPTIAGYAHGSKIIHDLEAYSILRDLLTVNPDLDYRVNEALAEVQTARALLTDFGKNHVYSTSYYIGNLLIAPNLTLHELLSTWAIGKSAEILEHLLADVRAGAVKIGQYYDVGTPAHYDSQLAGALYFSSPSFPSLTVSEVATVLYTLARLDTKNARVYEQALLQYVEQVWTSGAHFARDIEYALKLAAAYQQLLMTEPEYQSRWQEAVDEWEGVPQWPGVALVSVPAIIPLPAFPYESQFSIKVLSGSSTAAGESSRTDSLMLSLVDTRLPETALRLYEYNFSNNVALPFAVDLQPRQFKDIKESVGFAQYSNRENYIFLTGNWHRSTLLMPGSSIKKPSIVRRAGGEVETLSLIADDLTVNSLAQSSGQVKKIAYSASSKPGEQEIFLVDMVSGVSKLITKGSDPKFIGESGDLLYVRSGSVFLFDTTDNTESLLLSTSTIGDDFSAVKIDYNNDFGKLLVASREVSADVLVPRTTLRLFDVNKVDQNFLVSESSKIELNDTVLHDVKLSPDGAMAALTITESNSGQKPRLLLMSVSDGIIKKEINLSVYSPQALLIDDWVTF